MKTNVSYKLFSVLVFVSIGLQAIAQDGFGDFGGDNVPVDGGLSLLVAAGVGYGAKKLKEKKNNSSKNNQ